MKTSMKRNLIFSICLALAGVGFLLASYPAATIYTPNGSLVPDTVITPEFNSATISYINSSIDSSYPNATRVGSASNTYNCHAYAWHVSEGGGHVWLGADTSTAEDVYWNDCSYYRVYYTGDNMKVAYSGNHSAVTTSTSGWFISKWGYGPLMNHHKDDVPSGYGSASAYYKYKESAQNFTIGFTISGDHPSIRIYSTRESAYKYYVYRKIIVDGYDTGWDNLGYTTSTRYTDYDVEVSTLYPLLGGRFSLMPYNGVTYYVKAYTKCGNYLGKSTNFQYYDRVSGGDYILP